MALDRHLGEFRSVELSAKIDTWKRLESVISVDKDKEPAGFDPCEPNSDQMTMSDKEVPLLKSKKLVEAKRHIVLESVFSPWSQLEHFQEH